MARVFMSQYVVPAPPPVAGLIAYPLFAIPPTPIVPGVVMLSQGVPTKPASASGPPMVYLIFVPPIAHEWFE